MTASKFLCWLFVLGALSCVSPTILRAATQAEQIGALTLPAASDAVKQAVEEKGYRIMLDRGWTAEFWFAKQLKTAAKDVPGALYPELASAEFIGVLNLPNGMTDFR